MLRLAGRRPARRSRRPAPVNVPQTVQADYYSAILKTLEESRRLVERDVLDAMRRLVAERQDAMHHDAPEDFSRTIEGVRLELAGILDNATLEEVARGASAATLETNRRLTARQLKSVLGVDVLAGDPPLEALLQIFNTENVSLIKTIHSKYFEEIEALTFRNWRRGLRPSEIEDEIRDRFDVSKARARVIARDQTNKLNGQLTEARHNDLGIRQYRWRNSQDERVRGRPDGQYPKARPSHWAREGKIYRWDKPPEGGHPGEAVQCRCWAEPVIPGINE